MKNKIEDFYVTQFAERGFTPAPNNLDYCEVGTTWQLNDNIGTGTFWIYNRQNLFIRINRITISAGTSGLLLSFCSAAVSCIMPQKASFLKTFCHKLPDFA